MKLVLINPQTGAYCTNDDGFSDSLDDARVFSTILEADIHVAYLSYTYGVHVETRLRGK